jgi:hypothetical protein
MLAALLLAAIVAAPLGTASLFVRARPRTRTAGTWPTIRRLVLAPELRQRRRTDSAGAGRSKVHGDAERQESTPSRAANDRNSSLDLVMNGPEDLSPAPADHAARHPQTAHRRHLLPGAIDIIRDAGLAA